MLHTAPDAPTHLESGIKHVGNDAGKALSRQAYHEATEPARMSASVQQRESERTDYDSRSTWDGFLDAGSIPASSTQFKDGNIAQLGERSPD